MSRESTEILTAVIVALGLVFGGVFVLSEMSGVSPPFTVVESSSMQHATVSEIGNIDTGDMILLKSPDKTSVVSYVEGYASGYSTFGEYGNVIIYERNANENSVIHRAILWLTYNEDGTWSAPSLADYRNDSGPLWSCTGGTEYNHLSGKLTLSGLGYGSKTATIDLDFLAQTYPHSGYLTMGDNAATNLLFDQSCGISRNGLVTADIIHAVAWIEVPWLGAVKLWTSDNTAYLDIWAANSLPYLGLTLLSFVALLIALNFIFDEIYLRHVRKKRREMDLF